MRVRKTQQQAQGGQSCPMGVGGWGVRAISHFFPRASIAPDPHPSKLIKLATDKSILGKREAVDMSSLLLSSTGTACSHCSGHGSNPWSGN